MYSIDVFRNLPGFTVCILLVCVTFPSFSQESRTDGTKRPVTNSPEEKTIGPLPAMTGSDPVGNKPDSSSAKTSSVTPAAIAALVGQMEQLGDSLAMGRTDTSTQNASDSILARLDTLIEIQRQAEQNARKQSKSPRDDKDRQGKPDSQNDKNKAEDKSDENASDPNSAASQKVASQATAGQAPGGEGLFYGKGKGVVESKSLGPGGDWGGLPPEKREQAMRTIEEKFPPGYRLLIEQYFRKIAEEP